MKKSDLFSTMIASRAGLVCALAAALCLGFVHALPTPVDKPYDGIQVLSVEPSTEEQVEVLSELSKEAGIDFWSFRPGALEKNVFAVSPDLVDDVSALLQQAGMEAQVLIPDLQVIIDREAREQKESRDLERRTSFGFKAASSKGATFKRYMRYQEIADYAQELQKKYPNRVKVESMGKTVEGRDLWVVKVANQLEGSKNPAIFVDAGIHAREWIAPATALYLLNQITENPDVAAGLLNGLDWYIVPVVNPDGYEYTHTNERMWRKNRSKKAGCAGVDLNRNFGFHWNENGASQNPCSEVYSGSKGFSEPESQILRDFILKRKDQIKSYVTLHSYGKYILYPWGYTSDLPADWKTLDNIAQEANKALIASGSGKYTVGSSTNVLYAAAGGSDDWAKGGAGIPQSFTIELPGGGSMGFDMPPANIEKTVQQVFQGLKVFAQAAKSA